MSKYPVSKSDYENFRNVAEEIIKDFKKRPVSENRFYKKSYEYDDEISDSHAYALFLREIYSFRFPSLIIGYAKRQGLQWVNEVLQSRERESLLKMLKQKREYDSLEYTNLLFKEKALSIKENQNGSSFSFSVPILNIEKKDESIDLGIVERVEIEKALQSLISYVDSSKSVLNERQ
jgi:hypothetical protein